MNRFHRTSILLGVFLFWHRRCSTRTVVVEAWKASATSRTIPHNVVGPPRSLAPASHLPRTDREVLALYFLSLSAPAERCRNPAWERRRRESQCDAGTLSARQPVLVAPGPYQQATFERTAAGQHPTYIFNSQLFNSEVFEMEWMWKEGWMEALRPTRLRKRPSPLKPLFGALAS